MNLMQAGINVRHLLAFIIAMSLSLLFFIRIRLHSAFYYTTSILLSAHNIATIKYTRRNKNSTIAQFYLP